MRCIKPSEGACVDASSIIALISVTATLLTAVLGGTVKYLLGKLTVAEALVDAKQETIEELRRQLSEHRITAQIQDKFFSRLPPGSTYQPPARGGDET